MILRPERCITGMRGGETAARGMGLVQTCCLIVDCVSGGAGGGVSAAGHAGYIVSCSS